jgi:two-component system sensor histidine kinase BaeS
VSLAIEGRCSVLGDRDRLKQLIANLVENAVRYTPKNGRIEVCITGASEAAGVQHLARANRSRSARGSGLSTDMVSLTVADSGIGISPTDLPHVFERFYRADKARSRAHGGSGLGLSIAQFVAQAHGGSIQAASEGPNRGSVFSVQLPLLADEPRPATPIASLPASVPVAVGR